MKNKKYKPRDAEVWLDSETGLMWEMKSEENVNHKYVWNKENVEQAQNRKLLTDDVKDAFSYADKLNRNKLAGYNDWRLPTIEELKTLLTNETSKNKGLENIKYFIKEPLSKNTLSNYWCSTTHEAVMNYAWAVNFDSGLAANSRKHNKFYVRCVRAGQ